MSKRKRLPWFRFYPDKWMNHRGLILCSGGAQGLWMRMICIMWWAEPQGYFLIDGKVPVIADFAKLTRFAEGDVYAWLAELEARNVFSRTDSRHPLGAGVPYSRRMVDDVAQAQVDHDHGRKGGNPALVPAVMEPLLDAATKAERRREKDRERKRLKKLQQGVDAVETFRNSAERSAEIPRKVRTPFRADDAVAPENTGVPRDNPPHKAKSLESREEIHTETTESVRAPPLAGEGQRRRAPPPSDPKAVRAALEAAAAEEAAQNAGANVIPLRKASEQ